MTDDYSSPAYWAQKARDQATRLRGVAAQVEAQLPKIMADKFASDEAKQLRIKGLRAQVAADATRMIASAHTMANKGLPAYSAKLKPKAPSDAGAALVAMRELDMLKALPDDQLAERLRSDKRARELFVSIAGDTEREEVGKRIAPIVTLAEIDNLAAVDVDPAQAAAIDEAHAALLDLVADVSRIRGQVMMNESIDFEKPVDGIVRDHVRVGRNQHADPSWEPEADATIAADLAVFDAAVANAKPANAQRGPIPV